jgi:hypothetical protein
LLVYWLTKNLGQPSASGSKKRRLQLRHAREKSGQEEFDFDYGDNFAKHIEEFDPTFRQSAGALQPRRRCRHEQETTAEAKEDSAITS